MAEKRLVSCIVCPLSCQGEVWHENGEIKALSGVSCQRGQDYVREEIMAPRRMLTTTVRVVGGKLPLLPVVSQTRLPQNKIVTCARCLAGITVKAPVREGDVILGNILDLGVDIIASRSLEAI